MIVVCDQTSTAERIADFIACAASSWPIWRTARDSRTARFGSTQPCSPRRRSDRSRRTPEKYARGAAQAVSTVGKVGEPGAEVRCVVSVAMLTEGWDAQNVTQILGLRAFSSQLFCEQVVGRGLRRSRTTTCRSRSTSMSTASRSRRSRSRVSAAAASTAPKPQTLVQALRERRNLEITFPRVVGYISDARFRIKADVAAIPRLEVTPSAEPTWVKVGAERAKAGAHPRADRLLRRAPARRTVFEIAAPSPTT